MPVLLLILIMAVSCKNDTAISYMTTERAVYYFNAIEEICRVDGGRLWGFDMSGPVMFVDRESRRIIASAPDSEGILKLKDDVWVGTYLREKIIDVIAVEFGGTVFAMIPVPSNEDEYKIKAQTFHALTHRMQKEKGIAPKSFNNRHLNEMNARMWLKLEWKALHKAISSEGEERNLALRDALIFRGARHSSYPSYVNDETRFENYEGLATFTYTKLCTDSAGEQKQRLLDGIRTYYRYRSYPQYYGFVHGALYAFLLDQQGFEFSSITTDNADLGQITARVYGISLPDVVRDVAGSIAINYDIHTIREEEAERERLIKEATNKELSAFTEKPVIFIELESPSFGFETEDPNVLDTLGTIYKSLRVSDNWGKLVVDKTGVLLSHNLKEIRVPARGIKISKNHATGESWNIILNDSWEFVKADQNYYVKRMNP
ncbi:MAG: hypothetical protein FJY11_01670 [Bacteroidetes bacterium]|nr:hypothetical protein [Bacteroidota bacterium]